MNDVERSARRQAQYNLFFKIQSEGLHDRSITEYKNELWPLTKFAIDPSLRAAAEKAMHRYDEWVSSERPFSVRLAANSQ